LKINKRKIPKKEWTWDHIEDGYKGVNTYEEKLVWFTRKNGRLENGSVYKQSYEDFVRYGPHDDEVPYDIMIELYEKLLYALESIHS
jgi:hypothetical protein